MKLKEDQSTRNPQVSRNPLPVLLLIAALGLTACRSAFVETTVRNDGDTPIRLIEIDYPSASFGTQAIAPHSIYHYRFKVQGSGPITLNYTGDDGKTHTATGPTLDEGQQGSLIVAVDPAGKVSWTESLAKTR
jgi:hypothetical protein